MGSLDVTNALYSIRLSIYYVFLRENFMPAYNSQVSSHNLFIRPTQRRSALPDSTMNCISWRSKVSALNLLLDGLRGRISISEHMSEGACDILNEHKT